MDGLQLAAIQRARAALDIALIGLSKKDTQRYSLFRAIQARLYNTRESRAEAAFELECSDAIAASLSRELSIPTLGNLYVPAEVLQRPLGDGAVRAMSTTPGAAGGYLVGAEQMSFIDVLRARSVAMRMGARPLTGLVGNVPWPRQTGKATVTWQTGEGTSVSASDQALGQLSLTPKTCIAITDVSEQLLKRTGGNAEDFFLADLASCVAIDGVDAAVINGSGGAQPLGIKNTTGVTTGQDSGTATLAKLLAFVSTAGAANAIGARPGWVGNTAAAVLLAQRQRFTSSDTPLWEGNPSDGLLTGYPAMSSEQLASGNLIFGSWDEVVIGEWGVLELATSRGGSRFNALQVGIRAMWMVDVLIRHPSAFIVSTNLS